MCIKIAEHVHHRATLILTSYLGPEVLPIEPALRVTDPGPLLLQTIEIAKAAVAAQAADVAAQENTVVLATDPTQTNSTEIAKVPVEAQAANVTTEANTVLATDSTQTNSNDVAEPPRSTSKKAAKVGKVAKGSGRMGVKRPITPVQADISHASGSTEQGEERPGKRARRYVSLSSHLYVISIIGRKSEKALNSGLSIYKD